MVEYNKRGLDMLDRAISELRGIKRKVAEYDINIVDVKLSKPMFDRVPSSCTKRIVLDIEFKNLLKERI